MFFPTFAIMINYYEVLGIPDSATLDEIKRAYRKMVSKVHPDVNPSVNAHEEFIQLNQAYEYLVKEKSGQVYDDQKRQYAPPKPNYSDDDLFQDSRKRATENAKVKYEAFINSEYYKSQIVINSVIDYFFLGLILIVYLFFFGGMIFLLGTTGLMITGFFSLLFIPLFINSYRNIHKLSAQEFLSTMYKILIDERFYVLLLTFVNVMAFFNFAFVTFLPFKMIVALYILPPVAVNYLYRHFRKMKAQSSPEFPKKRLKCASILIWGVIPMLFSLFLYTNYYFSSNPRVESYYYEPALGPNSGSVCVLEGDKYEKYGGILFVFANDDFYHSRKVTFTIESGYWGIDVLTDYSFSEKINR